MKNTIKRPIWRDNEFPPNCRCTDDVYKFLRNVGGRNPYGENNYLAVIASEVRFLQGAEFFDYPEEVDGRDCGRLEFDEETEIVPVSTKIPGTRGHEETIHGREAARDARFKPSPTDRERDALGRALAAA